MLSAPAAAQEPAAPASAKPVEQSRPLTRVLTFLAGGAAGLVVHEAGHVFAVTHDPVSRRREYAIASSGFFAQHMANEWLLWRGPAHAASLRASSAPFRKGWLTFNLATSALYTAAALGTFGPAERDTRGMAVSAGRDGTPEPVIGVLILVPAALDGVRYMKNDPAWARWASRAVKAGLVLIAVR